MRQFYTVLEKIRDEAQNNGITNTVTTGNITEIDLNKTTIFPLVHIVVNNATFRDNLVNFNLRVLCLDVVDYTKSFTDDDVFFGNDNLQDVLNTQMQVANLIQSKLRRGDLYTDLFQLSDDPVLSILRESFESELAGWGMELNIDVANNETSIC